MRLERAGENEIKIYITFEELAEHGLSKDEVGKDHSSWNAFIYEIVNKVVEKFDLFIDDTVMIDIFSLHSQGILLIVRQISDDDFSYESDNLAALPIEDISNEDIGELYKFNEAEDIIQFALRFHHILNGGELHFYNNNYYLYLYEPQITETDLSSIIFEYANTSGYSLEYVREYGKLIFADQAIKQLNMYFCKN